MGYIGNSMSENAANAYDKGRKPKSSITKEDIQKYGIYEGITFFRWYIEYYCKAIEWHHSSPRFNETLFYDIKDCCTNFKNADIKKLKAEYAEYKKQKKSKTDKEIDSKTYYAKVKYSISTRSGKRKYLEVYAIIYKHWAYYYDDYYKKISKKNKEGKHFCITEEYQTRPDEMSEKIANDIINKYSIKIFDTTEVL